MTKKAIKVGYGLGSKT